MWTWLRRLTGRAAPAGVAAARTAFASAGLWFPAIPERLAAWLTQRDTWLFASRPVNEWPYALAAYTEEFDKGGVSDYVLLAHAGHGVNSYALHYYLVLGDAGLFVQLPWGGVYMDEQACRDNIHACFQLMDRIVPLLEGRGGPRPGGRLKVVASDFYGSHWSVDGSEMGRAEAGDAGAQQVLHEVLVWLQRGGVPAGQRE